MKYVVYFIVVCTLFLSCKPQKQSWSEQGFNISLLKSNGNVSDIKINGDNFEHSDFKFSYNLKFSEGAEIYTCTLIANEDINFNIEASHLFKNSAFKDADFYAPGFWYKKNLRSPKKAPSMKTSDNWSFRDDRMSYPMVAAYDNVNRSAYYIERVNLPTIDESSVERKGDEVLKTDIGSFGFKNESGKTILCSNFPFYEYPKSYQSKLSLRDEWRAFYPLKKGESISFGWKVKKVNLKSFEQMVQGGITSSFNKLKPQPVETKLTDNDIKTILTNYFYESLGKQKELTGFSGLWFKTKTCETTNVLSVGFCGKIFANSYNLLCYAKDNNDAKAKELAMTVLNSYFKDGFTNSGLIRELLYNGCKEDVFTLRKQAEGIKNLIYILNHFKKEGKNYPLIEKRVSELLSRFAEMQKQDGSLPRKFDRSYKIIDKSKGSTQSIITPMVMGYRYFRNAEFLNAAIKAAEFTEKELIEKSDYFSSTLDANCEDKEAALIASSSFMHLAKVINDTEQKKRYHDLSLRAAYFTLSWYFIWDVPFDKKSLLHNLGLKTRGWGLVSTENNHIDVYAFDFPHVLNQLSNIYNNKMFSDYSKLIVSSLREQMLPYENHMQGVGKKGYMPEIIQQSEWDYGANGKGYLNSHMSVGWTVASVWEMLSPGRFDAFLKDN